MKIIKAIFTVPISLASFVLTFHTVGQLMIFLSVPKKISVEYVWILNLLDNYSRLEAALLPLTVDALLINLFILQHSLMRSEIIKSFWRKIGLETLERSFYNLGTVASLLTLVNHWKTVPTFILWNFDIHDNENYLSIGLWWTLVSVHVTAWIIIWGGSILVDMAELLGLKQVYYDLNGLGCPMNYKSPELKRLYSHVRHPSFVGFLLTLWATNLMSLDRLILATFLSIYMYVAWSTDSQDVYYHKTQLQRKKTEITIANLSN